MHSVLENAGITVWRRLARRLGFLTRRHGARRRPSPSSAAGGAHARRWTSWSATCPAATSRRSASPNGWPPGSKVLIVDEPSVGIDIKTKAYLHELLRELSETGTAILLITSDMPEMITLADRIVVMNAYRIEGEITNTRDYRAMSEGIMNLIHRVEAA